MHFGKKWSKDVERKTWGLHSRVRGKRPKRDAQKRELRLESWVTYKGEKEMPKGGKSLFTNRNGRKKRSSIIGGKSKGGQWEIRDDAPMRQKKEDGNSIVVKGGPYIREEKKDTETKCGAIRHKKHARGRR